MIALSILAIIFTSIYGVYSKVLDVADSVDKNSNYSQIGYRALAQIANDLDSVYYPPEEDKEGNSSNTTSNASIEKEKFIFQGKSPSKYFGKNSTILKFSTTSSLGFNSTFPSHQINQVKYILEKTKEDRFKLVRQENPIHYLAGGKQKRFRVTLCPYLKEVELSFHSQDQTNPASSWNQGLEKDKEPPLAVEMDLTMATGEDSQQEFQLMRTIN